MRLASIFAAALGAGMLTVGGPGALGATAPHVQQRIVPGQAIGKVALGMTLKQVRKTLGAPESVIERRELAFGKTWVEYSWNLTEWRVAFVSGRVSRIGSSTRTERTSEGVGIGTRLSRVESVYRVNCREAFALEGGAFLDYWCMVSSRGGARTAFVGTLRCKDDVRRGGECREGYRPREVGWIYIFTPGESLPVRLGK